MTKPIFCIKAPGILSFFILFTLLLNISCRRDSGPDEGLTVFRYNEPSGITSLDPIYARNQANIWATSQLYNSLLHLGDDLEIKPSIAYAWEVSDDGLEYVFHLRNDIFFHDDPCFDNEKGRRVVAGDFVFSFSRLVDKSLNSPGSWVMNQVERNADGTLGIEALNDSTLVIRLQQAFPAFTGLLCMQYSSVIPREAINRYGAEFRRNPVGTGPFRFRYWKEGVKLVYVKNENYHEFEGNTRLPLLDAVSISFIVDRQTAFLEFIKGNLEFLSSVHASYKDELLTPAGDLQPKYHKRFKKISMPFLNTEYLGFLVSDQRLDSNWPLRKKEVRQAINYGFNRQKMMTFLRNNIGMPAYGGFVPVGMPGFDENVGGYNYDPDKARQLLARAGYAGGQGLAPITLQTNQAYQDIAQFIQYELARIGVNILIDVMPPATLREQMARGEARFFRGSWIADYPDAENYLGLFYSKNHSPAGPNYTHFSNKEFDKLFEKSLSITNQQERFLLYRKMNQIIIEEAPVVFLFYDQSVRFVPSYVHGMSNNPLNHLDLRRVSINK
jgi:oligopeptide transport system substrate-binding protein